MVPTSDVGNSGWVVEPPAADAAVIHIEVPEDADLTPELRQALDNLVRAMEETPQGSGAEAEVVGFKTPAPTCPKRTTCSPLTSAPCFAKVITSCTIKPCPFDDLYDDRT